MSDANRTKIGLVPEVTFGTTPATPAFENMRETGGSLSSAPKTVISNEIRNDRQVTDLIMTGEEAGGDFGFELSYGAQDTLIEAALCGTWANKPKKLNVTADSSITQVTDSSNTYTVDAGGDAFVAGMLARATGFTNGANDRIFRVGSSTGTTIVGPAMALVDEAAPPVGAKLQAVGFQGATGDLETEIATSGNDARLLSTLLDFTTLGLVGGEWLKIGGTAIGERFATAADNDWVRIAFGGVFADHLDFDVVPAAWANDTGSGKAVKVWFGDHVRNGVVNRSFTIERQFQDHSPVTYEYLRGMGVDQMLFTLDAQAIVKGTVTFMGNDSAMQDSGRFAGASDIDAPANSVLNTSSNVGRIAEDGTAVGTPNYVMAATIAFNNNMRRKTAISSIGAIGLGLGECSVTGKLDTYFGDKTIAQKVIANTASSYDIRLVRADESGHTILFDLPKLKFATGAPVITGKNTDVMVSLTYTSYRHPTLGYTAHVARYEYVE